MTSLDSIIKLYKEKLAEKYSNNEIDIIFYALAENILKKDKTTLKLALIEPIKVGEKILFENSLFKLIEGTPYQHVLSEAYFFGKKFIVNPFVLIPRPETEELLEHIFSDIKNPPKQIIDLCTGSGCIAIVLKDKFPESNVFAIDISKEAIETAKVNAQIHQTRINFIENDLLKNDLVLDEKLDLIVSNPPYIKNEEKKEMDDIVLKYEPESALFVPDEKSLIFYEKIIEFAIKNLDKDGAVYVEINQKSGKITLKLFQKYFKRVKLIKDISGNDRIIKAKELIQ